MAEKGLEVILGVTHDPQFGPVLMFGMGGILVEIFKDVSFRLIPLNKGDAVDMIHSIKALPLLKGYRGKPGVDLELLADMMVSVSELVAQNSVIREIDMNPIILYPKGAAVVDARMAVKIV
jgi:acyl-CoA synthetase (NDP forming)